MPANYPDFPHHSLIAAYFDSYVDHFGFRQKIRFETGVDVGHKERVTDSLYREEPITRKTNKPLSIRLLYQPETQCRISNRELRI
jgi:cation diffusion facilitator CzcD-associated flavoprotein CzcO